VCLQKIDCGPRFVERCERRLTPSYYATSRRVTDFDPLRIGSKAQRSRYPMIFRKFFSVARRAECPNKKSKVRDKGGNISVDLSIGKSGQSAECYIDRGVGAPPREAGGSSADTRCGVGL